MTTNIALVESADLRNDHITRTEALDHFTQFELPAGRTLITLSEAAAAFGVGTSAIERHVADHGDELKSNGFEVLTGDRLSLFKRESGYTSRAASLSVFSRRATLNLAMLLRDSEVARAVRAYLLTVEEYANAETKQVAAEMEKGSLGWYDELTSRGAVEFFANGNPKRFDPEYMPTQTIRNVVLPDEKEFNKQYLRMKQAASQGIQDAQAAIDFRVSQGFVALSNARPHDPNSDEYEPARHQSNPDIP